uniref:Subtilisin-like protease n=1 Tax=Rhizophora mucronata TaxID=61149 RepID=A0A2P2NH68_RHIMU
MILNMTSCYQILHKLFPCLLLLILYDSCAVGLADNEKLQTYIVHLDHSQKPASFSTHESWHRSILKSLSNPVNDQDKLLYSYNHVVHGFCARLTESQLSEIEDSPSHLATHKETFGKLFTTHSPVFLGLNKNHGLWPTSSYGDGVIIGIIDSGIWPESESFNEKGMPPVPQRWKGKCENGTAFGPSMCNRKLIGARSFSKALLASGQNISLEMDYSSARDFNGHGTHVASTAAGKPVEGVSYFGSGKGTAKGIAPRAHIAMYKAVFATSTLEASNFDVLAAIDQAIADGVDVLSMSLGFPQSPYFNDLMAIGSLAAVEKGVIVVCSSGNDFYWNTTHNGAPWITTVGAGTIDRSFTAAITLENGLTMEGTSYYPNSIYATDIPLYYGKDHKKKSICYSGALDTKEVSGKMVVCDSSSEGGYEEQIKQEKELVRVGAFAGIYIADGVIWAPINYSIPGLIVPTTSGASLTSYLDAKNTTVKVKNLRFGSTNLGVKPAPQVANFSSRGPDPINPGILKPDVLAPGYNILAAMRPEFPYMILGKYSLATDYGLMSGTSMATPHLAGVTALLKKAHPEWSPAGIRSAIMTTTYTIDNTGSIIKDQKTGLPTTPLAFGAGHVNPNNAMDPGLIYELDFQDYVDFLCGLGYTTKQMRTTLRRGQWNCSRKPTELNYPSFMAIFSSEGKSSSLKKFRRTLTNVGNDASVYRAMVEHVSAGLKIKIEPTTLSFAHKYQKQSFTVRLGIHDTVSSGTELFAYLKWIDQHSHVVSSPIEVIKF